MVGINRGYGFLQRITLQNTGNLEVPLAINEDHIALTAGVDVFVGQHQIVFRLLPVGIGGFAVRHESGVGVPVGVLLCLAVVADGEQGIIAVVLVVDFRVMGYFGDVHDGGAGIGIAGGVIFQLIGIRVGSNDVAGAPVAVHADIHGDSCFQLIGCLGGDGHFVFHTAIVGFAGNYFLAGAAVGVETVLDVHIEIGAHAGIGIGGGVHIFRYGGTVFSAVVIGVGAVIFSAAFVQGDEHHFIRTHEVSAVVHVAHIVLTAFDVGARNGLPAGAVIPIGVDYLAVLYFVERFIAHRRDQFSGDHAVGMIGDAHVRLRHVLHGVGRGGCDTEDHGQGADTAQGFFPGVGVLVHCDSLLFQFLFI